MNIGQTRTVINLATNRYWPGQQRLVKSIGDSYNILAWKHEHEVSAKLHYENNYSFKPLCFKAAYDSGYRKLLWLDASMNVIKDLKPIFDIIDEDGYFFQDSGWLNNRWTNYKAYNYFGTKEGRMLSSGVLGLDLSSDIGLLFLDEWVKSMPYFNGDWSDHRHDQTCASLIAHKMNLKLQDGNTFMVYGKIDEPTISDKTCLLADGIAF